MMKTISDFLLRFHFARPGNAEEYTKIVWARTYTVGCGFTGFYNKDGSYNKYLLCLYGPGGNIVGGSVYQIGPACSACPGGTTCEDGLCA